LGFCSSPFLGLLAVFDTDRTPGTHLIFVLLFFPFMVSYCFTNTSVYSHLAIRWPNDKTLKRSLLTKKICCYLLAFFTCLYLPIGMSLVSDWVDYKNDVAIHTFRAITQHLSILCLVFYFGTFWFDFGVLRMEVIQKEDSVYDGYERYGKNKKHGK